MGWNSWNQFLCNVNETLILAQAKALIESGLRDVGYRFLNIDDCWQSRERDENGRLQWNSTRFPSGIKSLADRIHSLGLKLGIYTDVGQKTCQGFPGSFGHFDIDADTFSQWGIDFLKVDTCSLVDREKKNIAPFYANFSRELLRAAGNSGRPIIMSVCDWGRQNAPQWASKFAYQWRVSMDIYPWYHRMLHIADVMAPLSKYASCGHFNDPDMLEIGITNHMFNHKQFPLVNLTLRESRTHFNLWSMLASPLILGLDLRSADTEYLDIIRNREVIAINQDPLCVQATRIVQAKSDEMCIMNCKSVEIWTKPLTGGAMAVLLFNRGCSFEQDSFRYHSERISFNNSLINMPGKFTAINLWTNETIITDKLEMEIQPHESVIFKVLRQ